MVLEELMEFVQADYDQIAFRLMTYRAVKGHAMPDSLSDMLKDLPKNAQALIGAELEWQQDGFVNRGTVRCVSIHRVHSRGQDNVYDMIMCEDIRRKGESRLLKGISGHGLEMGVGHIAETVKVISLRA